MWGGDDLTRIVAAEDYWRSPVATGRGEMGGSGGGGLQVGESGVEWIHRPEVM